MQRQDVIFLEGDYHLLFFRDKFNGNDINPATNVQFR